MARSIARDLRRLRLAPLAASLALAFPAVTLGTTRIVTQCTDAIVLPQCPSPGQPGFPGDGTLRQAYFCAGSGDSVDLTQLTCSTITLAEALTGAFGNVTMNGPGRDKLSIRVPSNGRVLVHEGTGSDTLTINDLTIADGAYRNTYTYGGGGGCIYSATNVSLNNSTVESCYTAASGTLATGGAIFAKGTVTLTNSTVFGSTAVGFNDMMFPATRGGGIYATTVHLISSNVTANNALAPTRPAFGGGVYATYFQSENSTVAANYATSAAGVSSFRSFKISNSTISGNRARDTHGGAFVDGTAYVYNSTIANNLAGSPTREAGLFVNNYLHMESSIVAGNLAGGVEIDVDLGNTKTVSGHNNLIRAAASGISVPADTITADPLLGPLQDNGGPTPTHALLPDSPAIDKGNNVMQFATEQRGTGFARIAGDAADIGAFEVGADHLFNNGFEPDPSQIFANGFER